MSRWHSTTINFQTPSDEYHLEIIRHPDEDGQDCIAGENARVRVYRYAPMGILQAEATGGIRVLRSVQSEERNEVVTFQWGWGDVEMWDLWGQKRVYSAPLSRIESKVKDHQYEVPYQDVFVRRDTPGDLTLRAWFGDTADPEIEAEISLNFLDPADPGTETPTGSAPLIQAVRTDSGPIHPGVAHTVRVYHWHPDDTAPDRWEMSGVSVSAGSSGTQSITEEVEFRNGVGSISIFDTNGIRERIRADLAGERIAYDDVTYSAPYQDFSISGAAADTPYAVSWYWDSGEETMYQFQATEPQPGDFPDESPCEAAGFYWYDGACHADPEPPTPPEGYPTEPECIAAGYYWWGGACHADPPTVVDRTITVTDAFTAAAVAGVSVYVDGLSRGMTDAAGHCTITSLNQGQTYSLRLVKTGYIDSDLDEIANDSFVA